MHILRLGFISEVFGPLYDVKLFRRFMLWSTKRQVLSVLARKGHLHQMEEGLYIIMHIEDQTFKNDRYLMLSASVENSSIYGCQNASYCEAL